MASTLKLSGGEQAPPLAGGEFRANWNGLTVVDLFDRIRTSMPLNNPQSLNRETNAAILSYILSVNRFPAGQAELPSRDRRDPARVDRRSTFRGGRRATDLTEVRQNAGPGHDTLGV